MIFYEINSTWLACVEYVPVQRARERDGERERKREVGLTYRGNLQSCRVFRDGRRALRLIATAPANRIPISRFPVRGLASGGSHSSEGYERIVHKSRPRRTSELRDGRYRDCHSSSGTNIETKRDVHRRSIQRGLIDIDGFSSRSFRPFDKSDTL